MVTLRGGGSRFKGRPRRPQRHTRAIVAETFDLQHFVYRLRARPST